MTERISDITIEHLGEGATDATVDQFKRACEAAIVKDRFQQDLFDYDEDGNVVEEEVIEFVWNMGDFDERIYELLNEQVAF